MNTVYDFLQSTRVVDIFYCKDRPTLKQHLFEYLDYGVKSLARKYIAQTKIPVCEYRIYKVLTFFDVIRNNAKQHSSFAVFISLLHTNDFLLVDYLLDYILSDCTLECVKCIEVDFFTHYAKRHRLLEYRLRQASPTQEYFVTTLDSGHEILVQKNKHVNSMMLLDFNRVYKVVALRHVKVEHSSGTATFYIITLFTFIKHMNYPMIADFWLPRSCLGDLKGSKFIHPNGRVNLYQNQFIRVVGVDIEKNVKIQSYTTKSITQLKKAIATV